MRSFIFVAAAGLFATAFTRYHSSRPVLSSPALSSPALSSPSLSSPSDYVTFDAVVGLDDEEDDIDDEITAQATTIPFKACKSYKLKTSPFEIKSIVIDPSPPRVGANISISVSGTLKQDTKVGSEFWISIRAGSHTVRKLKYDFCLGVNKNTTCPVKAGDITFDLAPQWLGKMTPKRRYHLKAEVKNKGVEKALACIDVSVKLRKSL